MRSLIVDKKFNNKKIETVLMNTFPMLTKNTFFKAIRKKDIRVNDIKVNENTTVYEGDKITLYILDNFLFGEDFSLDIVYEDKNILLIHKPKNMEVTRRKFFIRNCIKKIY